MGDNKLKNIANSSFGIENEAEKNSTYDIAKDAIFQKYANKSLPLKTKKTRAGLTPYTGAFTEKHKIHLLRRAMFGVKRSDVLALNGMTASQAVDLLLNNSQPMPAPPVNYYEAIYPDITNVALGQTWINAEYGDGTQNYYRKIGVQGWWMESIINQNVSIDEKMVVFLHNYFPILFDNVDDARWLYRYMLLLRTHKLGNLKTFIKELTKDGAMLFFLNGHYNVKNSPDENYGRELQELFTIGKGTNMYTEDDVKEAAKVLTGWRVDDLTLTVNFEPVRHETANKTFTTFYNNTTIAGLSGAAGANELDSLLNMIFSKDQLVAKYFARKLYRFFVYYDIDANIETTIIDGLAQTMIANNWDIKPVLSQLLKSDHFFDTLSQDCFIRTPMDYYLGLIRTTGVNIPIALGLEDYTRSFISIANLCSNAAMNPGTPPSVSGWPAFYQIPHFHQMWINSDTLPKRMRETDRLLTNYGIYVSSNTQLKIDVLSFCQSLSAPSDPDAVVSDCVKYLLAIGLSQSLKDYYKSILLSGQSSNFYWTNAWNDYINNPGNTTYAGIVRGRLQNMLTQMLRMAEHHLS